MRERLLKFLEDKGVTVEELTDESILMHYISSADFMELIVTMEQQLAIEFDLESTKIEQISTLGGFVQWLNHAQ